ncbi:MAG: DNA replication/repair protein RecF [Lachnospiraceae bacterium]|nr:DNA replication/repair protein RecF [Lachnospiraceae bacterium]
MIIEGMRLKDFRNYENLDITFSDGINIFYGDNAQGKTNLLEAVFLAATTKSQRGSKEREMIRLGCEEAHIRLYMTRQNTGHKIDMHLKKNNPKGAAIDGIRIKKSTELYGMLHVISFSPEDLQVIKMGPSERRRFMDMELCQLDRIYTSNLQSYNRALFQKNNLLRQLSFDKSLEGTLEIWNEQLAGFGREIINTRKRFIEEISGILEKKHEGISGGKEKLEIKYLPNVTSENFKEKLSENVEREIAMKQTLFGPHKDDLGFFINGDAVRIYGSQGQQRSVALSLKLAEIELVKGKINDKPVLLLDDVLSELDRKRSLSLFKEIQDVQTFITCTGLEEFIEKERESKKVFHVTAGTIDFANIGQ